MENNPKLSDWKARGQRLTQLRQQMEMTRSQLARRLGVTGTTIKNWEVASMATPGIEPRHTARIIQVFEALGLSVDTQWLLTGRGPKPIQLKFERPNPLNPFHFDMPAETIETTANQLVNQWGKPYSTYRNPDDAMQPFIYPGDILIVMTVAFEDWRATFQHPHTPALVQFKTTGQLLRFFSLTPEGMIQLSPANYYTTVPHHSYWMGYPDEILTIAKIAVHFHSGNTNLSITQLD